MKRLTIALILAVTPVAAEEDQRSLLERGAEMFLEGLIDEMGPAIEGMQDFALEAGPQLKEFVEAMGPALADIVARVEDWSRYEPPELLPNGDIIIRRKPDKAQPTEEQDSQIDI